MGEEERPPGPRISHIDGTENVGRSLILAGIFLSLTLEVAGDAISLKSHATTDAVAPPAPPGGALAGHKPRVIISTDVGGSDPDDFQSMVHLLVYANVLDIEGLISSPPQAGRVEHVLEVIDAYEKDYANLKRNGGGFPTPEALRRVTKQGAVAPALTMGWSESTAGSRWIIKRAKIKSTRPLWVLVWGSITDVAQAVHDDPSIKESLRVYSIGSWNTRMDQAARDYLYEHHANLWWIESDTTFRGMYVGGKQDGPWCNQDFVSMHVQGHGALGNLFFGKKKDIKMGDTPSLLYLLRGDANDPTAPHWGGAYVKTDHGENYWTDDPDSNLAEDDRAGAKTVNRWRVDFLTDWQQRMDWAGTR
jgi:cellulose-binding protein